jgi:DNA modification methylase
MEYSEFLATKQKRQEPTGFIVDKLDCDMLFDFQADITKWALRLGKAALFMGCGTGKSPCQLTWAHHVCKQTNGNVLILAPLAVSKQTQREGEKFGIPVTTCRSGDDVQDGINITNYEMMHKFHIHNFAGIVLDESSILKSFTGKYRNEIIEKCKKIPYKLCCTATPAPNDYIELGNHAEFLDICTQPQMLAQFFVNDRSDAGAWRLKGHAKSKFWEWLCSWGLFMRDPGDIGYDNDLFQLPPIEYKEHIIKSENNSDLLFNMPASTLNERRAAKRDTISDRVALVAKMVNESNEQWLIWCNLNDESEALTQVIPDAVEVQGKHNHDYKEAAMMGFSNQSVRVLVSKPSIAGFGMNWQQCHHVAFVGLSDSFEQFYQATRRCWRFGQMNIVDVHIIIADRESSIRDNIGRKEKIFQEMYSQTIKETRKLIKDELDGAQEHEVYRSIAKSGDKWEMIQGDCIVELKNIVDDSIDFSIFSPPFASLYTFSDNPRDMGNCNTEDEFCINFDYLSKQLARVTKPGRQVAIHCMDLPAMKGRDGYIGLKDFPSMIIKSMESEGFIYHSKVTIWKSPVLEVTRTKTSSLLYRQLKKDSTKVRVGLPDYVVVMRKDGENEVPVTHTEEDYGVDEWAEVASPVWMHINQTNTLNRMKGSDDERHISPLQLDTIRDLIRLYTNPNDLILSPFAGIGSEGYQALLMGRQFIGVELKQEYFDQAVRNLHEAIAECQQASLI